MFEWLRDLIWTRYEPQTRKGNGPRNTKIGLSTFRDLDAPTLDFVFIHDLTEDRDDTWKTPDSQQLWPEQLLGYRFPTARLSTFGYDASVFGTMAQMLDIHTLETIADTFLRDVTLNIQATSGRRNELSRNVPLVVFAHGYGGLIYEKAVALSCTRASGKGAALRPQMAVLFGTPHYRAGLAEWAIMSATELGMISGVTAQTQDWTAYKEQLESFRDVHDKFSEATKPGRIRVIGCFATLPLPDSNLFLSPEWALLPSFIPVVASKGHFGMTRFDLRTVPPEMYVKILLKRLGQLVGGANLQPIPLPLAPLGDFHRERLQNTPQPSG